MRLLTTSKQADFHKRFTILQWIKNLSPSPSSLTHSTTLFHAGAATIHEYIAGQNNGRWRRFRVFEGDFVGLDSVSSSAACASPPLPPPPTAVLLVPLFIMVLLLFFAFSTSPYPSSMATMHDNC